MEKALIFSTDALEQIQATWRYIDENLSSQAADNLLEQIDEKVEWIRKHPETGRLSEYSPQVRYVLVGKHRRLYYEIGEDLITIAALFDTRQDPKKRPF
jgi:plasmid stabilization system protein ParE